ncbi:CrcB protein [Mumia flava]|uniref:Fluoride-specific ion channel FluC n=1 Tax=Mumia flava TaxID=1348852 RepID=A0A0B2BBW2_9ACTN|nr:CrcB family protein [Mumia flava]PJJ53956.1 CrcB protein [Mumia flava]
MSAAAFLLVCLGGAVGAAGRFVTDQSIRARWPTVLPVGTIAVNVVGSFVIGLAVTGLEGDAYRVVAIGFCGGFTTFSTATTETVRLVQAGDVRRALVNAFGTLLLAIAAAAAGLALGDAVFG